MKKLPSINDILVIKTDGEWQTKSGGTLSVLYKIGYEAVSDFLSYDEQELSKIPADIRGLRSYIVEHVSKDSIGANEWHRVRNEIVFALKGSFSWTCTDTLGQTKDFVLDGTTAILTPHHILHTYVALEDDSTIGAFANTIYIPEIAATHDTYSAAEFATISNPGPNR